MHLTLTVSEIMTIVFGRAVHFLFSVCRVAPLTLRTAGNWVFPIYLPNSQISNTSSHTKLSCTCSFNRHIQHPSVRTRQCQSKATNWHGESNVFFFGLNYNFYHVLFRYKYHIFCVQRHHIWLLSCIYYLFSNPM